MRTIRVAIFASAFIALAACSSSSSTSSESDSGAPEDAASSGGNRDSGTSSGKDGGSSVTDAAASEAFDASACCTRDPSYDSTCGSPTPEAFLCYCPQPGPAPPESCAITMGSEIVCCP